ncbi:MAG: hypothetical protein AAB770_01015 [Patescibacteria group bacterium]
MSPPPIAELGSKLTALSKKAILCEFWGSERTEETATLFDLTDNPK